MKLMLNRFGSLYVSPKRPSPAVNPLWQDAPHPPLIVAVHAAFYLGRFGVEFNNTARRTRSEGLKTFRYDYGTTHWVFGNWSLILRTEHETEGEEV